MRGEIPRSPRTLRKRERRPEGEVRSTWSDKVLKTGPFVVSLTGLFISIAAMLVTLTVNGPMLMRNGKDFVKWYRTDHAVSGHWNNSGEGDIEAASWSTSDDDAVFLNIDIYQGQISGTAVSQRLCKYSLHTDLFVEGRMAGNDGFATFWDFVGGKRQAFAKAKLHIDRANDVLDVNVTEQAPGLLPATFRLGKGPDYTSSEEDHDEPVEESEKAALKLAENADQARYQGSFCKDAVERVEQAVKQARK
jgi:hypothetical protein